MNSNITGIVINWNLKFETAKCLRSIQELETPCNILVVDNGSNDNSAEYFTRHFPDVELILQPQNIGFGAACNQAIKEALKNPKCNYVFLINNDAVLHPAALTKMIDVAQNHPESGIFGPKIYYADEKNKIWYAGARRRQYVLAATDTGQGQVDRGQFDAIRAVDYIFGTAMLIRRKVFEKIGFFDESFFLYLEDLDFCLRAQQAGIKLMFAPHAKVWHQVSASTLHNEALRRYHLVKSTMLFLGKHTSILTSVPVFLYWALVTLRTLITDLIQGDFYNIEYHLLGLQNGISGFVSSAFLNRIQNLNSKVATPTKSSNLPTGGGYIKKHE